MAGLVAKLRERARLWRLKRNEFESQPLRDWFARDYGIEVGLYSYGCFDRWRIHGPVRIGRWCSFAQTARAIDANHPMQALTTHPYLYEARHGVIPHDRITATPLIIEDDVWVGHHALILPGCRHIGRGAIIGAGAIVTHDVPAYTVVAGVPARPTRMRFPPETIAALEASNWWTLDRAGLAALVARHPDLAFHPTPASLARLKA
jgi:acetyltransferase-like isoleucine patch superfamily enzyme